MHLLAVKRPLVSLLSIVSLRLFGRQIDERARVTASLTPVFERHYSLREALGENDFISVMRVKIFLTFYFGNKVVYKSNCRRGGKNPYLLIEHRTALKFPYFTLSNLNHMSFKSFMILFESNKSLTKHMERLRHSIQKEILLEPEEYILNVGEQAYVGALVERFKMDAPLVDFSKKSMESKSPTNAVLHLPVTGDISLLSFLPSEHTYSATNIRVDIEESDILLNLNGVEPSMYSTRVRDFEANILPTFSGLTDEILRWNTNLNSYILSVFQSVRCSILDKHKILEEQGIPLYRKPTSGSFTIPAPSLRKKIHVKPEVNAVGFTPEPSLSDVTYLDILKTINDAGKNFERMPSVYRDKGEDALRDHILFVLDPNFKLGSASGETFNFSGRTDISLRYESSVVFVGECKFWGGETLLRNTIDQLLGYLTWRNTKTSLILFVKNKKFQEVIDQISNAIQRHPCYISEQLKTEEAWFNFTFSLPSDKNREIKMAVQLFHIPRT